MHPERIHSKIMAVENDAFSSESLANPNRPYQPRHLRSPELIGIVNDDAAPSESYEPLVAHTYIEQESLMTQIEESESSGSYGRENEHEPVQPENTGEKYPTEKSLYPKMEYALKNHHESLEDNRSKLWVEVVAEKRNRKFKNGTAWVNPDISTVLIKRLKPKNP